MGLENTRLEFVNTVALAEEFMRWLGETREVLAFDTETEGLDPERDALRLVQFGDMNSGWAIPWNQWGGVAIEAIQKYTGPMVAHNAKFDVRYLERYGNIRMPRENIHDTRIMCHLLDPTSRTALKPVAARLVDAKAAYASQALDEAMTMQKWTWATVPIDFTLYWCYGALDTVLTAHVYNKLKPKIDAEFADVYKVEQAVQFILADMEARGSRIDIDYTTAKSKQLSTFADSVSDWCMKTYSISPGSNREVTDTLLKLGVNLTTKTKSGNFALDEDVIAEIIGGSLEDIDSTTLNEGQMLAYQVLARRKSEKIRSTYLDGFLSSADADGFLHPQINQLGARTGRMSMERPALQTLPRGRVVRDCFIPREGNSLISADFDGVEMRCLAHFAQDQNLIDAINSGDIHLTTARRVYGDETISKDDPRRQIAKGIGFAKIYGAGAEKIALTAGISLDDARQFLTHYDATFPGVKQFQTTVSRIAEQRKRESGRAFVKTPIGRLQLSDDDKDYALVNSLIQGMAADVFKEALIRLDESDVGEYLLLPVHDEVIVDAPTEDIDEIKDIITQAMSDDRWAVPLTVGIDGPLPRWGAKYGG
jgi:DNA polymerase-1